MNAVISGRAGLALVIEGEALLSLDVDDLKTLVPRHPSDLRFLLSDATDLVTLENTDRDEIAQRLDLEHAIACALDMTLIALDSGASIELRAEAAAALDELLADVRVIERLEFTMYAKPLPEAADLMGALFCTQVPAAAARVFFERLDRYQSAIGVVREAWDALPDSLFGEEPTAKTVFHDAAYEAGLFRLLTLSYGDQAKVSVFLLEALKNSSINTLRNYRTIVTRWCAPIRVTSTSDTPVIETEYEDDYEDRRHQTSWDRLRRREPAEVVLRKVESQKALIVGAMRERDLSRAFEVLEQLVEFQIEIGRQEHLVKSLCDLAIEANILGNYSLQLELTNRAVEARPSDAWSWAQRGDALLNTGRLDEAAYAYEQADAFGAGVFAKSRRAEVLRAQGRLLEAEAAFDEAIALYPENLVAKIGRAQVLQDQGRLSEAEAAFNKAISAHPDSVVAKTGLAYVLKAQGRLSDAEAVFNEAIAAHPEDIVAKTGRAEVLKAQGRLVEAEAAFDEIISSNPDAVVAKIARAEALKAQGRFLEVEAAYDEAIAAHPENVVAKIGRAEVLKAQGRLLEAEAAFDEVIAAHPDDVVAKIGRADVLKAQGRLLEAEATFSEVIAAHPENVFAQTGRADTLKAQGRLEEAATAFNEVIAAYPENVVAKNGLAEVLKAQGKLLEAEAAFNEVIAAHPENVFAQTGRADILKAQGRLEEAEAAFNEVIAAYPEDVVAKNGLADVLRAQGRLIEAEAGLNEGAFHPEVIVAKTDRAEVLKAHDKCIEAEAGFDEVIAALYVTVRIALRAICSTG
jgi:tetratricopeptide (TPR) repeat protein